jgi:hypothetical protein
MVFIYRKKLKCEFYLFFNFFGFFSIFFELKICYNLFLSYPGFQVGFARVKWGGNPGFYSRVGAGQTWVLAGQVWTDFLRFWLVRSGTEVRTGQILDEYF